MKLEGVNKDVMESILNLKFLDYQKQTISLMNNQDKKDIMFGNDYSIEFNINVAKRLVLSVKDFDKNQK